MSKSRRRSSQSGIDPANIVQPDPDELEPNRRRSLRIRRNSRLFCIPSTSANPTGSPTTPMQDSLSVSNQSTTLEPEFADTNISSFDLLTPLAPSYSNPKESIEKIPPPIPSPPSWLRQPYEPPKHIVLETLPENRPLRGRSRPLCEKNSINLIRRQIFTGQTLEEACLPQGPGMPQLDPKVVLSVTRMRVRSRHQRARRLGFKGIQVSYRTERRLALLMQHNSFSPTNSPET